MVMCLLQAKDYAQGKTFHNNYCPIFVMVFRITQSWMGAVL